MDVTKMERSGAVLIVLSALVLGAPQVFSFETKTGSSFVFNNASCGQYANDRKLPKEYGLNPLNDAYIQGYLSALNMYMPGVNIAGQAKPEDVELWIDGYCRNNPLSSMPMGLFEFGRSVGARVPIPAK